MEQQQARKAHAEAVRGDPPTDTQLGGPSHVEGKSREGVVRDGGGIKAAEARLQHAEERHDSLDAMFKQEQWEADMQARGGTSNGANSS